MDAIEQQSIGVEELRKTEEIKNLKCAIYSSLEDRDIDLHTVFSTTERSISFILKNSDQEELKQLHFALQQYRIN